MAENDGEPTTEIFAKKIFAVEREIEKRVCDGREQNHACEEKLRAFREKMLADKRGRKWHQTREKQEENRRPNGFICDLIHGFRAVMEVNPHRPDPEKRQRLGGKLRPHI